MDCDPVVTGVPYIANNGLHFSDQENQPDVLASRAPLVAESAKTLTKYRFPVERAAVLWYQDRSLGLSRSPLF
ncbi:MAG: hypothetical protein KGL02_13770 [Acidobacteriota bacterium]|nr:hypothetical protein [Acidobacteriota bacterium]